MFEKKNRTDVQKGHTSRCFVQTQPRPSGLEVQPTQDIGFRMSVGFGVVLERTSESGVFCGPAEDFVPVRGKDSVKRTRGMSSCPEAEVSGREWGSQRVIGMLDGKDSDAHRRNVDEVRGGIRWDSEHRRCAYYMLDPPGDSVNGAGRRVSSGASLRPRVPETHKRQKNTTTTLQWRDGRRC